MKTSTISKLAKLIPALALNLVLGLILTTGLSGKVSAVAAGITHVSGPNDGDSTTMSLAGDYSTIVFNSWQLDASTFPDACTLDDVDSITATSVYSKSGDPIINPAGDGGGIFIGQANSSLNVWGNISLPQGHIMPSPYIGLVARDYTDLGGQDLDLGPLNVGGTWSSATPPPSDLVIMVVADANNTGGVDNVPGAIVTVTKPVVDVGFKSSEHCLPPTNPTEPETTVNAETPNGGADTPAQSAKINRPTLAETGQSQILSLSLVLLSLMGSLLIRNYSKNKL